jgi:hypothetical protein
MANERLRDEGMNRGSSRRELLGSIITIASMSFLAGLFFMSGFRALTGGGWEYIIQWALIPFLVLAVVLHARKILNSR